MMLSIAVQLRRSCLLTAEIEAALSQLITKASNSSVYRLFCSAQGTLTVRQPCSGHCTRGTWATTGFGTDRFRGDANHGPGRRNPGRHGQPGGRPSVGLLLMWT